MTDVVEFRRPERARDTTSFVGMAIFLGCWSMTFAALFFAYFDVRLSSNMWPPEGELRAPILWPAINTAVLFLSSVTMQLGLRGVRAARPAALKRALVATLLLGVAFLALQLLTGTSWWSHGIRPSSGRYGSVLYLLSGFHALHVLVGLVGLALLLPGAFAGRFHVGRHASVRNWTWYWHFVDVIWLGMFFSVFMY